MRWKRAALSLSLSSLISLVLAIMIFSSGVYFLTSIGKKVHELQPPDTCPDQLRVDVDNGLLFSVCPTLIKTTTVQAEQGMVVQYVITNPSRDEKEYWFEQPSTARLISPYTHANPLVLKAHETRMDTFTLRVPTAEPGQYFIRIVLKDDEGEDYTRTITLQVR